MKNHPYELRVRLKGDEMLLDLYELPANGNSPSKKRAKRVFSADEERISLAQGAIARVLKNNKHNFADVKRNRKAPFRLSEEDGVRLEIILKAIQPLKKRSRIEDIMLGIESMPREEAYYWHAKITKGNEQDCSNGLKAIRMMIGGE